MGALFNILSLWASSISSKMNTINSLRLSSQRTNCFRKSGVFLSVRGRNGLSHLQGLVVVVFVCWFFFFFSPHFNVPWAAADQFIAGTPSARCCVRVCKVIGSDWLQYVRLSYSAENYWALKSTGSHTTSKLGKHMSVSVWKWALVQEQLSIRRMSIVP